jgi:ubiquinone/menaquinone biosynthesis C-methylase UbiE
MEPHISGKELRDKILGHYYTNIYKKYLFGSGSQAKGILYFEEFLEKSWDKEQISLPIGRTLEIGAGQGEHWPHLRHIPLLEYVALDLRPLADFSYLNRMPTEFRDRLNFIIGNAEKLPFADNYFDRTFSTCLLHHVEEPLDVLMEARRVTKPGGEILFIMPTDPGLLNQFVKRWISYRALSKLTNYEPKLFYALEHKNHVRGLMNLIEFIFEADELKFRYSPIMLPSWNLNLMVSAHIRKSEKRVNYLKDEITDP